MTLITDQAADYWLKKASKAKEKNHMIFDNQEEWADGFCGK